MKILVTYRTELQGLCAKSCKPKIIVGGAVMDSKITLTKDKSITSMEVAEMIGKEHNMLLRDIRRYIEQLGQSKIAQSNFFTESTYKNKQNKEQPCYNVTKKGCEFIAHKLTGIKGTAFTARYINRFHDMEEELKPKSPAEMLVIYANQLLENERRMNNIESRVNEINAKLTTLTIARYESLRGINVDTSKANIQAIFYFSKKVGIKPTFLLNYCYLTLQITLYLFIIHPFLFYNHIHSHPNILPQVHQ